MKSQLYSFGIISHFKIIILSVHDLILFKFSIKSVQSEGLHIRFSQTRIFQTNKQFPLLLLYLQNSVQVQVLSSTTVERMQVFCSRYTWHLFSTVFNTLFYNIQSFFSKHGFCIFLFQPERFLILQLSFSYVHAQFEGLEKHLAASKSLWSCPQIPLPK